ncbi:MAG: thioredoxin [Atopostipes sp.]|nr:thioredoxin [Atopostipes sp.]
MVKALTDETFKEETSEGLSLVDFWAEWCGPCKMQSPIIEEMAEESDGSVDYYTLDVDANQETAGDLGIMSIPTLLIKKDGKVVDALVGYHSKEQITEKLNEYQ